MKQLYLLISFFLFSIVHSQNPATIDITYDYTDHNLFLNGNVRDCVTLSDGKTVIIGNFTGYQLINGAIQKTGSIIRLNPDLSYDKTFNVSERIRGRIISIAKQSTGKILIAGDIDSYDDVILNTSIIRLNADGSLDTTFNKVELGIISKIQVDSNDKIYAMYDRSLTRLNPDGERDSNYSRGTAFTQSILASIPSSDGTLFLAGGHYSPDLQVYKLNARGRTDSNFNNGDYSFNCSIFTLAVQSDGKVLVGGLFNQFGAEYALDVPVNRLLRLNQDGSIDPSFVCPELIGEDTGRCNGLKVTFVMEQPDKKILVGGVFPPYNGAPSRNLIRLNSDGSIDNTFKTGTGTNVGINSIKLRPNGNIFVCASNINGSNNHVPLVYDGYTIGTFFELDRDGKLLHREKSSKIAAKKIIKGENQKYIVLGESRSPYHRGLKVINVNGTLSLNKNLFDGFNKVNTIQQVQTYSCRDGIIQPDGKILIIGDFSQYNKVNAEGLIRLNRDYSIDPTFSIEQNFKNKDRVPFISSIALQADHKILVGSYFDSYNGLPATGHMVRLNPNGELDTTFNFTTTGDPFSIRQIEVRKDGKIMIIGNGLLLLNPDGTVDTTFKSEKDSAFPIKFELLNNGKILVLTRYTLKRLNSDGSIDNSFHSGTFGFAEKNSLAVQSDGKILFGGSFSEFNDIPTKHLVRLNSNGTIDPAFNIGTGFNGPVESILIESDGKIVVAGSFDNYNGAWCNGSIRLLGGDAFLISGQNKFDFNNNGCDLKDVTSPNLKFNITSNSINNQLIADKTGDYAVSLPSGKHTIIPKIENPAYFNVSPKNITVDFPSQASPLISNFCITPNGTHPDLEITLLPISPAIPGFTAKYKILYKNKGNQLQSGTVNLTFDDILLNIVSTDPVESNTTASTLKWNFTNLHPLQTREISITVRLNKPTDTPPTDSGTILKYTTEISSTLVDDTPKDNTFTLDQIVVNSFDPNDKTCLEGATIQSSKIGEYVHYVIRFENLGSYKAHNIIVKDIIDTNKFDISSLVPQNGSHSFTTKISEGNKVEFLFEGINLPFDNANNDGYVAFKIKTNATLKSGDEFSNFSSIYFDYNFPIVTNTATTKIESNLSNPDFSIAANFILYPNPVNDILFISKKQDTEIISLSIYNILGQLVLVYPNARNLSSVNVSDLPSGSYFIKIKSTLGASNITFIKK